MAQYEPSARTIAFPQSRVTYARGCCELKVSVWDSGEDKKTRLVVPMSL